MLLSWFRAINQAYNENKESSNCFKQARLLLFESLWATQRPIFHVSSEVGNEICISCNINLGFGSGMLFP